MPHWQKDVQPDLVNRYMGGAFTIQPVRYTQARTTFPTMRVQYTVDKKRVQFQFFALDGEKFPQGFVAHLEKAFKGIPQENVTVDYVNEAKSWYVEVRKLAMPSPMVAERLLVKLRDSFSA